MTELYHNNSILSYMGVDFQISGMEISSNGVFVNCTNAQNDFWMLLIENETIINGVLQTSSQMIYDTLSA
jgi:hypothetical protein